MKKVALALLLACSVCFLGSGTQARAAYPYDRPINVIVPFGPGGAIDIAARILSDYFQKNYKITVNVINKPGGGQAIGINEMLRARPDGYTLAFPGFSSLATTPKLTQVGYTLKDIRPIAQITVTEPIFSTSKSGGLDSFAKFLDVAKADPDKTVYATTGAISTQRLYMVKLLERFHPGLKVRHAAYGSGHEVSTALLGRHITAGFQVPTNVKPYVESGDFTAIAISRATRHPDFPDTPTFRELYKDQLTPEDDRWIDLGSWHGLITSKKVPDDRIAALEPLLVQALNDPEVVAKFKKVGLSVDYLDAPGFGKAIQASSDLVDEVLAGRKSLD